MSFKSTTISRLWKISDQRIVAIIFVAQSSIHSILKAVTFYRKDERADIKGKEID